jgi:hypothetical protein
MRSQLVALAENAQDPSGMFHCVVVSAAGDKQWGTDPCPDGGNAARHPDDITMVMVATYEQYVMNNDTALVDLMYPKLLLAFGYYVKTYQASAWHTPYKVHETYDAVPETAEITGEGNRGSSLYNAVNYLCGLHCMLGFAQYKHDDATAQQVESMIAQVKESIQQNFWQPEVGFYIGDTNDGNKFDGLLEANGYSWKSADGLHGQVLSINSTFYQQHRY